MAMQRIRCPWTTGPGGAGLSTFYFSTGSEAQSVSAVSSFFNALQTSLPAAVTISVPNAGDVIDETTGLLTGVWAGGSATSTSGAPGTTNYAAGTGGYIRWLTGGIVSGHRVQGRTFICPIPNGLYDAWGTIVDSFVTAWQTAASALVSDPASEMLIWSRPKTGLAGSKHVVTSAVAPDRVTSLRSRRS